MRGERYALLYAYSSLGQNILIFLNRSLIVYRIYWQRVRFQLL